MKKENLVNKNAWQEIDFKKVGHESWRDKKLPAEVKALMEKWQNKLYSEFKNWTQMYYSRFVTIYFTYDGENYKITAADLNVPDAYLENRPLSEQLIEELKGIGCTGANIYGFTD